MNIVYAYGIDWQVRTGSMIGRCDVWRSCWLLFMAVLTDMWGDRIGADHSVWICSICPDFSGRLAGSLFQLRNCCTLMSNLRAMLKAVSPRLAV